MQSVREAKDKRAKKLAIGGAVLLVAVLAFEIPHVMKKSGGSSNTAAPATATTAAGTSAPASTPTTATGTTAVAALPATSTKLPNSDVAPRRLKSQLFAFSKFASKDPFVQQVSAADITNSPSSGASASGSAGSSSGGNSSTAPVQQTASRTLAQTGAVTLRLNGKLQTVSVGASFPSSNPLFKLVGVAHGVVRIGITNGSYSSGAQTVSLGAGRSLTLVDTADGVRYKLTLIS
jgi:hypothetical protein